MNEGLSFPDVWSFLALGAGQVFAGTWGGGIFRSLDDGVSWQEVNEGSTSSRFWSLARDRSGIVYAGSWGRGVFRSSQPAGVESPPDPVMPAARAMLRQNYPNPFNPVTTIRYSLPGEGHVRIDVYSSTGRRVATLVNGTKPPGDHEVVLEGRDLPSGVYLYRIRVDGHEMVRKMLLLR